jgi:putative membrane protein
MRCTFTMIAVTAAAMGLCLASTAWAQQVIPGTQPLPPGAQPLPPGVRVLPPGAQVLPPGAQVLPPGAQPLPPGVQVLPPGAQPLPPAGAQPVQPDAQPAREARQAGQGPVNDRLFVMAAAAGGMAEVMTSTLALQRAEDPEVRQFAQRMIADHNRANQELMSLAGARGIGVPAAPDIKDQAEADVLSGLRRAEFDRAYIRGQVAAHLCAVGLFEAESQRGADPELRAFAAKTLPTLREHLQHARQHMGQGGRGAEAQGDARRPEGAERRENAERANDNDRPRDENRARDNDRPRDENRTKDEDRTNDNDRPRSADRAKGADRSNDADQPK